MSGNSFVRRNHLPFLLIFLVIALSLSSLRHAGSHGHSAAENSANSKWSHANNIAASLPWADHSVNDSEEPESSEFRDPSSFIPWLQSRGITPDKVPFVTLGDHKYSPGHRALRARLDQLGYGRNCVVLCLDAECARDLDFGFGGFIGQSVAALKFTANLELAMNGYNFVFLDGDVYLTGAIDPFDAMLPLSDDSWDIQFQPDEVESERPNAGLNIGWYYARSCEATIKYFARSRDIWEQSGRSIWDQEVMDKLGQQMEFEEHSLKIYRLYGKRFLNFMLYDWETNLFGNEPVIQKVIDDAAMFHYTCVQQNLKTFFGLNFGGYSDIDGYYSKPPPLLAMVNVSGQSDSIHGQVAFAAQVANRTGRTLVWPDSVDMIQRVHYDATEDSPEKTLYLHNPIFPGIRAVSFGEAQEADVPVVEGRYLRNQARNNHGRALKQILVNVADHVLGEHRSPLALETYIGKMKSSQVAVLDFSTFGPQFLRKADQNLHNLMLLPNIAAHVDEMQIKWYHEVFVHSGAEEYTVPMFSKVRRCGRADATKECLNICNGEGMG